jgi:putative DNA primase/helicase
MPIYENARPGLATGSGRLARQITNAGDYSTPRVINDFGAAMSDAGIAPPADLHPDGELHRFHVDGDRASTENGWYVLHLDGVPAGGFGSWKTGIIQTWCAKRRETLTPAEQARVSAVIEAAKRRRETERQRTQAQAAERAARIWNAAKPAVFHPYLRTKRVLPFGTRVDRHGNLVVPATDGERTTTLQFIAADGSKRFLSGGRISGCWFSIDTGKRPEPILIAEGFATGATLHQESGCPIVIAFNSGNLAPVAREIRRRNPQAEIIIAADNDAWTPGNPGVTKARAAALEIGARLLLPSFAGIDTSGRPTDWNDWYALRRTCGRAAA